MMHRQKTPASIGKIHAWKLRQTAILCDKLLAFVFSIKRPYKNVQVSLVLEGNKSSNSTFVLSLEAFNT